MITSRTPASSPIRWVGMRWEGCLRTHTNSGQYKGKGNSCEGNNERIARKNLIVLYTRYKFHHFCDTIFFPPTSQVSHDGTRAYFSHHLPRQVMKQDMYQMMQHMHHKQTALETQNRQPIIIQNHANARKETLRRLLLRYSTVLL
jgi:hypothetical protein